MADAHPFRLDAASGVPFYRQIIDQVLLAVGDGRLTAGSKLPTVRQLSVDLEVNLNTVARAYKEMEVRGIVQTQQGTGTFVAARRPERKSGERRKALERALDEWLAQAAARGFTPEEVTEALLERIERPETRR